MKVYEVICERNHEDKPDITQERRNVTADNIGQVFESLNTDLADEALEVIAVIKIADVCEQFQEKITV